MSQKNATCEQVAMLKGLFMEAQCVHIQPVYSRYHPTMQVGGMRLLQHQVETWEAFNDPDVDGIINTAMTGDGKSLAGYLPALVERQRLVAMYPTNELIRDQCGALPRYQQSLGLKLPPHTMMYGERITQLMREHENVQRLEEVRKLLSWHKILLTNPDLIHLMLSHQYGWDFLRKELPVTVGANFDYFLFDEFHVFGVPQIVSVANMLGYVATNYRDNPKERRKFLFLSATPNALFERLLKRNELRFRTITGHYSTSDTTGEYRRILQPCDLALHEISQETPTEAWIESHLEQLRDFFRQYPDAKAAILVSSPATARRLVVRLKAYFAADHIRVDENSGLVPIAERPDARDVQILIGTSTVDVGIDFHINYLIFEAFTAGSFLQRFGRLGRHDEFASYRAYALVPRFVLERLSTSLGAVTELDRPSFNELVRAAFPMEQEFEGYTKRWGILQAAHVLEELHHQHKKDANTAFATALSEQYERIYGTPEKPVMAKKQKQHYKLTAEYPELLKDLLSFRGQSPLDCGVWDQTTGHILTYDLFFLVSNADFEPVTEAEFLQQVRLRGLDERDFKGKLLYLKVISYVPERLNLVLGLPHNLSLSPAALHHAQVLDGFFLREPRPAWLDAVNRALKTLRLTCVLSDMPRRELKQRLNLGAVFPVYRLQDNLGGEYSVAFGQSALLLDSVLWYRKCKDNNAIFA